MFAGLIQQLLGGVLLRVRMEARKAAFAAAAGILALGALLLATAAGLVFVAAHHGAIAALLAGAAILLVFSIGMVVLSRRVPGAAASPAMVAAEAAIEDVPAPENPAAAYHGAEARGAGPALARVHDRLRGQIDGVLPAGSQGALTAMAAQQFARRPVPTLAAAVAAGAVFGILQRRQAARAGLVPEAESAPDPVASAQPEPGVAAARARYPFRRAASRRRPGPPPAERRGF